MPDKVGGLIQEALHSPRAENREYALSLLASEESSPRVFDACLQGLVDRDPDVRLTALLALDDLRNGSALDVVLRVADTDPSPEIRQVAMDVYESLSDHRQF